jgi:hypothetical protein
LLPGLEKGPATAVPGNQDRDFWLTAIRGALTQRSSRSLAIAEQGLKAYPTDPELLLQAALTAIASGKPERSLALLKRYGKRYVPNRPVALLTALALGDQEQYGPEGPSARKRTVRNVNTDKIPTILAAGTRI